jgi:hypothetical protein
MTNTDDNPTPADEVVPSSLSVEEHQAKGARTARRVVGGILTLALILGTLAYYNYSESSRQLNEAFEDLGKKGATLATEECVPAILEWHQSCEAMKTLCDHAIPMAMTHCLGQPESEGERFKERQAYCDAFKWPPSKAKWTYAKCKEIGISKDDGTRRDRIKACGNAFGAIENFCRHNAEGVRL